MNLNTSNKLKILISSFLIGFLSLFTLNQFFSTLIKDLDSQTTVHETKIKIGEFVAEDIQNLKALFFELAVTTSSKRSRQIVINKIRLKQESINDALDVLENGGELNRKIALNVAGQDSIYTKLFYDISKDKNKISLEVIDIRPKILQLTNMIEEVDRMLHTKSIYQKEKDIKSLQIFSSDLKRYYKSTPAFFARMSENIKRLLYEGEKELNKIKSEIKTKQEHYTKIKFILMLVIITLISLVAIWLGRSIDDETKKLVLLNSELGNKESFVKAILNGQENMVIVSDGEKMIEANDFIAQFFDEFETIEDFKKRYTCICDKFEPIVPDDSYINKKQYDKLTWLEYILANQNRNFKVIMNSGRKMHHFSIIANKKVLHDKGNFIIVVSLSDITSEIESQQELAHLNDNLENLIDIKTKELQELNNNLENRIRLELQKNREKDQQMIQQSRYAALGEMIGNIAHQWRQPLSAISSTASSVEVQMQLGLATDDDIKKSYEDIRSYVQFLTQTIEDFRGFFKEDKELIDFDLKEVIIKSLSIVNATYKDNNIKLFSDVPKEIYSHGIASELSQVFLNIFNNARDAIKENNPENRNVIIYYKPAKHHHILSIQDNAGGIPENIITKIFDPYFTTKHQSQGTGIGLYMSKEIVEKNMKGQIKVENKNQYINGLEYNGACFTITLPKVELEVL